MACVWVIILRLKVGLHLLQALSHACCVGLFFSFCSSLRFKASRGYLARLALKNPGRERMAFKRLLVFDVEEASKV